MRVADLSADIDDNLMNTLDVMSPFQRNTLGQTPAKRRFRKCWQLPRMGPLDSTALITSPIWALYVQAYGRPLGKPFLLLATALAAPPSYGAFVKISFF